MSAKPLLGVVQFPHPGPEHRVGPDGTTPWNKGDHRRKFIRVNGSFVDGANVGVGPLVCWAEWEAPSRLLHRFEQPRAGHPVALVEPVFTGPAPLDEKMQNTDPYIFGERFLYTYCKQVRPSRWSSTRLSNLSVGTLVLFGSHLKGDFVLDTAFVVGDSITHSGHTWRQDLAGVVSPTYRAVTLEPMYADPIPPDVRFQLYRGVRHDDPLRGTFSFFPCLPITDERPPTFARPRIQLDGIINPNLKQGMKTTPLDQGAVAEVLTEVVRQVRDQDLALGVAAEEPRQTFTAPTT
jgi:hypothetical protein